MSSDPEKVWVLTLNRYQRNNLLQLINFCGYPAGEGIHPFTFMNNGDWLGEIGLMLSNDLEHPDAKLSSEDTPNMPKKTLLRLLGLDKDLRKK